MRIAMAAANTAYGAYNLYNSAGSALQSTKAASVGWATCCPRVSMQSFRQPENNKTAWATKLPTLRLS